MSNQIECHGHTWTRDRDRDIWETKFDRFTAITWKFGSIHQSKVFVHYELKIDGKVCDKPLYDEYVPVGLYFGKTREEAMKIGLDWVEQFQKNGPESVEQSFKNKFEQWPTLYYGLRLPVIDHLFFMGGSGVHWVDGAVMNCNPQDHIGYQERKKEDKELNEALAKAKEFLAEIRDRKMLAGEDAEDYEDFDEKRKKRWLQDTCEFYPVHRDYATICQVPDDVRPDWLELAYEAAKLLRDKSGILKNKSKRYSSSPVDEEKRQLENRQIGTEVVAELERRFPHVKKDQQVSPEEAR